MTDIEKLQANESFSGCFKFSTDYLSKQQILEAVRAWINEDPKVERAVLRRGGNEQIAIDFLYNYGENTNVKVMTELLDTYFTAKLGRERPIHGWDVSPTPIIIK